MVVGIEDKTLVQVCIIVKDLEATMQKYADILGFDLPEVQETLLHDHTEATYHGKPTDARARNGEWYDVSAVSSLPRGTDCMTKTDRPASR